MSLGGDTEAEAVRFPLYGLCHTIYVLLLSGVPDPYDSEAEGCPKKYGWGDEAEAVRLPSAGLTS